MCRAQLSRRVHKNSKVPRLDSGNRGVKKISGGGVTRLKEVGANVGEIAFLVKFLTKNIHVGRGRRTDTPPRSVRLCQVRRVNRCI